MKLSEIYDQRPQQPIVVKRPIVDGYSLNPDLFIEHAEKLKAYNDYQNKASVLWHNYNYDTKVWLDRMIESAITDVSYQFPDDKKETALSIAKRAVDEGDLMDYTIDQWKDLRDELEIISNLFANL